jgi:hypothetical protein
MGLFVCAPSRFSYGCTARVRAYQPRVLPVEEADEVGRAHAEHRPAVPIYSTGPAVPIYSIPIDSTGLPYLFIAPAPPYLFIAPAPLYLFIAPLLIAPAPPYLFIAPLLIAPAPPYVFIAPATPFLFIVPALPYLFIVPAPRMCAASPAKWREMASVKSR